MRKIFIRTLWVLLILSVAGVSFAFYAIREGKIGYMPPIHDLENPINRYATQVYSADGKVMGTWNYDRENRVCVDYSQLAPSLINALVATAAQHFLPPKQLRRRKTRWMRLSVMPHSRRSTYLANLARIKKVSVNLGLHLRRKHFMTY